MVIFYRWSTPSGLVLFTDYLPLIASGVNRGKALRAWRKKPERLSLIITVDMCTNQKYGGNLLNKQPEKGTRRVITSCDPVHILQKYNEVQ